MRTTRATAVAAMVVLAIAAAACDRGDDGSFCEAVRDFATLSGGVGMAVDGSMSEEEIEREFERFEGESRDAIEQARQALDRIESRAPADIAADVRVVVDLHRTFLEAFEAPTLPQFDPSAAAATQASFERVREHTRTECGVAYPADEPAATRAPPEPPAPPPPPPAPPAPPAPPSP